MKIGMVIPNYARWLRGDEIWEVCEKAKEMDLDSLYFVDHVIVTAAQYAGYGNGYMDIWTAMSYAAAVTNIQGWSPILGQCVVVIPYRPPIQQAKIIATLDSLSKGRVMIGAGTGYNPEEFAALGLNIHERGDYVDEYLKAMIELWTHPVASFHGKYVNFDEMTISVRPVQQPHPRILVGARGKRPFRRIASYCHGWVPGAGAGPDAVKNIEESWAEINTLWKEYGREGKPYLSLAPAFRQLTTKKDGAGADVVKGVRVEGESAYFSTFPMTHVDELAAQMRDFDNIGADMFVAHLPSYRHGEFDNKGMLLNQMELFAEHVLPKVPRG